VLSSQAGGLTASTFELGNSVYAAPAAPPVQDVQVQAPVPGQSNEGQHVLPVDIAGTQIAGPQTEFSNVGGSYAQTGEAQQGQTADVAYFSPVTTTSVDVVPPATAFDPTPTANQQLAFSAGDTTNASSLEQVLSSQAGGLTASTFELGNSVYAAPAAPPVQDVQVQAAVPGQSNEGQRVLPVDIAGTQIDGPQTAGPQTEFSHVGGTYAQTGDAQQGKTADVAYFNPVTTTSVDVVPPATAYDSTSIAQHLSSDTVNVQSSSLEQLCSNQVGGLSASTAENSPLAYSAQPLPFEQDVSRLPIPEYGTDQGLSTPAKQHVLPVDIAGTQLLAGAVGHLHPPESGARSIAPAAPVAPAAPISQPQSGQPKRGLSSIFSEIDTTMGKKSPQKPPIKPPVVDPATQDARRLASNTPAKENGEPSELIGKMTNISYQATKDALPGRFNPSLERQMLDTSNHVQAMPGSALSAALGRANAASVNAKRPDEYLNNALMDYHSIHSLLNAGKVHEAQLVSKCALGNLANCQGNDLQFQALVQAFIHLFQQKNMTEQVDAFNQARLSGEKLSVPGTSGNIWNS
jgi:hypothetical protein